MVDRKFKALRQFKAIRRTGFRAKIAKHAPRSVEGESRQYFLLVDLLAVAHFAPNGAYLYAIDRAGQRAQIARYAKRPARFWVEVQSRRAAIPFRYARRFKRILLRVDRLVRVSAVALFIKRARIVSERERKPFEQVKQQESLDQLA